MSEPALQLNHVSKKIGNKTIIDQLTMNIFQGEVFGLLGPNGAGKTTTIRMMVGLISISSGEILIQGQSITKNFKKAISHVGAVVENPEFYRFLSGYQNLDHYAHMHGSVTPERFDEVITMVGLEKRIHDPVKTYSLGMRQRLGIAQALLHQPSVLILDEPTNGLDPAGIKELREHLRYLAHYQNVAVIVSSHLLSEMELMCDRTAIIQKGRLLNILKVKASQDQISPPVYLIEVDDAEKAKNILSNRFGDGIHVQTTSPTHLKVRTLRETIPDITSLLINAGIKTYEIRLKTKSLEEAFMEVTSNEPIN